jgi:hypothetical protein
MYKTLCTYPPVPNKTKVVPNMVAGNGVRFTPFGYQKFVYTEDYWLCIILCKNLLNFLNEYPN